MCRPSNIDVKLGCYSYLLKILILTYYSCMRITPRVCTSVLSFRSYEVEFLCPWLSSSKIFSLVPAESSYTSLSLWALARMEGCVGPSVHGLPCAAKIMHSTLVLFDLRDPGTASYLETFEGECQLLSLARHPNIVQYLATYRDPETNLPVLLMEICNESKLVEL